MISPVIGTLVLYTPRSDAGFGLPEQLFPAFVCYVHNDTRVNLCVSDSKGHTFGAVEVQLLQDEDEGSIEEGFAQFIPAATPAK
jgi:hypothetical protein